MKYSRGNGMICDDVYNIYEFSNTTGNKYLDTYNMNHPVSIKFRDMYIWAVSQSHIDYLRAFTQADIRYVGCKRKIKDMQSAILCCYSKSLGAKLPYIYKTKKYRKQVLKKLDILEKQLNERNIVLLKS